MLSHSFNINGIWSGKIKSPVILCHSHSYHLCWWPEDRAGIFWDSPWASWLCLSSLVLARGGAHGLQEEPYVMYLDIHGWSPASPHQIGMRKSGSPGLQGVMALGWRQWRQRHMHTHVHTQPASAWVLCDLTPMFSVKVYKWMEPLLSLPIPLSHSRAWKPRVTWIPGQGHPEVFHVSLEL